MYTALQNNFLYIVIEYVDCLFACMVTLLVREGQQKGVNTVLTGTRYFLNSFITNIAGKPLGPPRLCDWPLSIPLRKYVTKYEWHKRTDCQCCHLRKCFLVPIVGWEQSLPSWVCNSANSHVNQTPCIKVLIKTVQSVYQTN